MLLETNRAKRPWTLREGGSLSGEAGEMWKKVSKEEFNKYLEANKDRLIRTVCLISQPPSINYLDKKTGDILAHEYVKLPGMKVDEFHVEE